MSDFKKNILLMMLTAVFGAGISSFATISSIGVEITNLIRSNERVINKLDKHDERIRANEISIAQSEYLAVN